MGLGIKTLVSAQQFVGTSLSVVRESPMIVYFFVLALIKQLMSIFVYHIFIPPINPLHNEIALVIGADTSLGRAFACRVAKMNGTVICVDTDKDRGEVLVKSINDEIGDERAFFYEGDVRVEESLVQVINDVTKDIGDISIILNCAPINLLLSSYLTVYKTLLPIMKGNKKGHLVFIKSFDAESRQVVQSLYNSISKDLRKAEVENVRTTIAYVYPRLDKSGEKNPVFGNIKPDFLAEEILEGVSRNRKEIYLPDYMLYTSFWFRLLPSGIANMVEDFLFNEKK